MIKLKNVVLGKEKMSKITLIEQALSSVNDSIFHRICSAYIHYKFDYLITDSGLALGKDKPTIGTPDSFVKLPNGNFIFVEITTQEKGAYQKFIKDLNKCFDICKTGIPLNKIEKIFLCYSRRLSPKAMNQLNTKSQEKKIILEIVTIDTLKYELFNPYSSIAKEFLGLDIDTGQILTPQDFIRDNDKNTTTLKNPFISREKELEEIHNNLENSNLIIINGAPGVGKTRLALQASVELKNKNSDYEIYIITNKGIGIYDDLKAYFLPSRKYILIIDDANRINQLSLILELAVRDELEIQIIITIRDYAVRKIHKQLSLFPKLAYQNITINKLQKKDIIEILKSVKITNPSCIDKISNIADGNPRLTMMAAEYALKLDDCNVLNNVSDIYDRYYEKILQELDEQNDNNLLKVLGIICFFRTIDKNKIDLYNSILKIFNIKNDDFWEKVYKLNELEIIDLYEDQIAKISDQVLAEYFFYHIFIETETLDYSLILQHFLTKYSGKVKENLYPLLNYYGYKNILNKIEKHLQKVYTQLETNEKSIIVFFDVFWFCRKTKLLLWLKNKIDSLPFSEESKIDFSKKEIENKKEYPYLELLKLFGNHPDNDYKISLEIIFKYLMKKSEILPKIIYYFINVLNFNADSYKYKYSTQTILFDFLFEQIEVEKNNELYIEMIFSISNHYLKYQYESTSSNSRDRNTFSICRFLLNPSPEIEKLRKRIWIYLLENSKESFEKVFIIFNDFIENSFDYLQIYSSSNLQVEKLVKIDLPFIINYFESSLDRRNYQHCSIVHKYFNKVKKCNIEIKKYNKIIKKFTNKTYEISLILDGDYLQGKKDHKKLYSNEFQLLKDQELKEYFTNYSFNDFENLIEYLQELSNYRPQKLVGYHGYNNSLEIVLIQTAKENLDLCLDILKKLFELNNEIDFSSPNLIIEIMKQRGNNILDFYKFINKYDYINKDFWILNFLENLDEKYINEFYAEELIKTFRLFQSSNNYLQFNLNDIQKFKIIRPSIIVDIFQILLKKTQNSDFKFWFHHFDFIENYSQEFFEQHDLLKQLFFYYYNEKSFDYDGKWKKYLLFIDSNFIEEYLKANVKKNGYLTDNNENDEFDFIWELPNYQEIIEIALKFCSEKEKNYFSDPYSANFFPKVFNNKIEKFIFDQIKNCVSKKNILFEVFKIISHKYPDKRIEFLDYLLKLTQDYQLITSLPLTSNPGMVGSMIPVYESEKKFWKEVEKSFDGKINLLQFKQWAIEQQQECQKSIEWRLERDFANEY